MKQNFVRKMQDAVNDGIKLGTIVLNAGVLKYPNRATDMYVHCPTKQRQD